eukprot:m.70323 g.70323  ORF g.70323 m.70323 type:complete len:295 (+) comp12257_c0_seq1:470-1354(+)
MLSRALLSARAPASALVQRCLGRSLPRVVSRDRSVTATVRCLGARATHPTFATTDSLKALPQWSQMTASSIPIRSLSLLPLLESRQRQQHGQQHQLSCTSVPMPAFAPPSGLLVGGMPVRLLATDKASTGTGAPKDSAPLAGNSSSGNSSHGGSGGGNGDDDDTMNDPEQRRKAALARQQEDKEKMDKMSGTQRLKYLTKRYGKLAVAYYVVLGTADWALYYAILSTGVDVQPMVDFAFGLFGANPDDYISLDQSNLIVAYAIHNLMTVPRALFIAATIPRLSLYLHMKFPKLF